METPLYRALVGLELALALPTFAVLRFIAAPYGRHVRRGWGPTVPARLGWLAMESPAALGFACIYALGRNSAAFPSLALLGLWELHYVNRAFVFPFRMRAEGKRMPVVVALLAIAFNGLNAWNNARWISELASYPSHWLRDPRFVLGALLFLGGFAVNVTSDNQLRRLRGPGQSGYAIPRGGLFDWVSCPNYLGEICEWVGWAIASWSVAGLAFALYTVANLAPRARAHHAWYQERFPDYPQGRKALIPLLW